MAVKISEVRSKTWDDFNRMSRAELVAYTQAAAKATNQRLGNFEKTKEYSPAVAVLEKKIKDNPNLLYTRGKTTNQLRRDLGDMLHFLNSKTSTVAEARKSNEKTVERLVQRKRGETVKQYERRLRYEKKNIDWRDYWERYEKLITKHPEILSKDALGSDRVQQLLLQYYEEGEEAEKAYIKAEEKIDKILKGEVDTSNKNSLANVEEELDDDDGFYTVRRR